MKTMKKFWKYFLNFVILMLLVSAVTYLGTKNYKNEANKPIECIVQEEAPVIEIVDVTNKKITGTVTNNTNILINEIYVKVEFYNEQAVLLGTEYKKIKYFNVGEKSKFEIDHLYKNVSTVKITMTDVMA